MKDYKVKITEVLEKTFTINAKSAKEALQIVDNNYRAAKDEYILSNDGLVDVQIEIIED